jgi:hypothetical protein
MESHNTLESKSSSRRPSSASTLNERSSTEMKSENTSIPETQIANGEKVENIGENTPMEVTWDGDNDVENPRNWPKWKKW